jgi:exodeoxyribonuclease VII large subunit
LNSLDLRRTRQISVFFEQQKLKIRELERLMPKIDTFVSERNQYLDLIVGKLESAITNFLNQKKLNYARSGVETLQPKILQRDVYRKRGETESLSERLSFAIKVIMQTYKNRLVELERLCESLSYRKTLERGYAIVRDENQKIVDDSKKALNSNHLILEFKDDRLSAKVKTK